MLTAKSGVEHRIKGLEQGADDYLGKPFDVQELTLRIRSILKRVADQSEEASSRILSGKLVLDEEDHSISIAGEKVDFYPDRIQAAPLLSQAQGTGTDPRQPPAWGLEVRYRSGDPHRGCAHPPGTQKDRALRPRDRNHSVSWLPPDRAEYPPAHELAPPGWPPFWQFPGSEASFLHGR